SLGRSAAAAIANAIDYEHERSLVRALRQGFVPARLRTPAALEVGVRYEPAGGQPAGGDVYGLWSTGGGDLAVLVGDVSGKGLEVAASSAMVRFFAEARSLEATDPGRVLREANALLRTRLEPEAFATVFLALVHHGELRYCS